MQNIYFYEGNLDLNESDSNRKRLKTNTDFSENNYLSLPASDLSFLRKKHTSKKVPKNQLSIRAGDQTNYDSSYFYEDLAGSSGSCSKMHTNEKTRLLSINEAFEILRTHIPTFPYERRLSKIDTLHLAISYINLLESVIASNMNLYDYLNATINNSIQNSAYNNSCHIMKPCWATSGKFFPVYS